VDERVLRVIGPARGMRITVSENGPYLVSGGVPLVRVEIVTNEAGESVSWLQTEAIRAPERYSLCRCGHSCTKPFCDGSHDVVHFEGTETAGTDSYIEVAACIDGPGVKLRDARKLCAEARFCDRAGGIWNLIRECEDPAIRSLVLEEAALCPSGRYSACDPETDEPHEPAYEPSIALVEDPSLEVSGPLWVRGGIPILSAAYEPYEVRNRVTLCRCGHSGNKPFCDGSHIAAKFSDADSMPLE